MGVSTHHLPAGAVVPSQRDPHRWLRQHQPQSADIVSWDTPGHLLAPRAPQASEATGGDCVAGPPGTPHAVPHLVVPGAPAQGLRVFALGQQLRRFVDRVTTTAGTVNGARVRRFQDKKAGWYAILEDPRMPVTSTLLDQAHNAIERKLFAMKGFHHPGGSQQAFLTGLAHLYNLVPYQRRAQYAGQCGVEVEGGRVPTADWFLNVQILTSGGFR